MVLQAIRYTPAQDSNPATLEILDQLALPFKSTYFYISNCEDAHKAIKQMRVRGAPAIAIVAALALAVEMSVLFVNAKCPLLQADAVKNMIDEKLEYLKTSRPTAVNLADAVSKLKLVAKRAVMERDAAPATVSDRYMAAAEAMLVHDVNDNKAIGTFGAQWIKENTAAGRLKSSDSSAKLNVLTHCNTGSLATAGYGTALGVIRSLHADKMLTRAYCSETRPYNQGSRLTAYELVHDEIPATLITDSMVAALLAREGENLAVIVVGADRVAANGDTANKIGTYSLAILARHHGVKFLVAAPRTTIDLHTKSGADITIEERAAEEMVSIKGPVVSRNGNINTEQQPATIRLAAEGIEVWNPAFDVTPAALIDGVVTELGVVEKNENGKFDFTSLFEAEPRNGE